MASSRLNNALPSQLCDMLYWRFIPQEIDHPILLHNACYVALSVQFAASLLTFQNTIADRHLDQLRI
jgi:hypothetical protein